MNPDIEGLIQQTADHYNLDPTIFRRQLIHESGLNPNAFNPKSGSAGIAQFMPATAKGLGIDPMDPAQAIPAAGLYMRQHLNNFGGDYDHALAAYNWGPGNLAKHGLANAPAETRNYIATIRGTQPMPLAAVSPPDPGIVPIPAAAAPATEGGRLPPPPLAPPGGTLADAFMAAAQRARGA